MRHAAPSPRRATSRRVARVLLGAVALWSEAALLVSYAPRYEKVSLSALLSCLLALSVLPRRLWPAVGTFAKATATFLMATAGVVAGMSVDEAVSLLAVAVLLGIVAALAGKSARIEYGAARPAMQQTEPRPG